MKGNTKKPIQVVRTWVRRQPPKMKVFLAFAITIAALIFIRMVVYDHDNLFIDAEAVHALGISVKGQNLSFFRRLFRPTVAAAPMVSRRLLLRWLLQVVKERGYVF
ncbi:hypothetical protein QVD17_30839 [Tagetes erecta]|uniref:Uncharacterized protein n=1 Tax=Tagetes erecta TaxID=13708 RepID=A0AAD8NML9_TARER|nr:hypothetical protein QVD17_30839 [Tagetes erecta]